MDQGVVPSAYLDQLEEHERFNFNSEPINRSRGKMYEIRVWFVSKS